MDESQLNEPHTAAAKRKKLQITAGFFRFSVAQFLVALVMLLAVYPFLIELEHGGIIEAILMTVVLISAVLAVGGRTWVLAIILVIPAIGGPWIDHYRPGLVPAWIMPFARMVFVGFVVMQLLRFVARAKRVNSEVLCAGISGYLVMGLFWASAYLMASQINPGSFHSVHAEVPNSGLSRFDALYFSLASLTSLGCSDVTPLSKAARMLMVLECLTGVLYLAVLIARLVAMYSGRAEERPGEKP